MIPIIYSDKAKDSTSKTVLAGDLGGTKMNLALFNMCGGKAELLQAAHYASKDYTSLNDIIREFLSAHQNLAPQSICIGVAGPVIDGVADLTNLDWTADVRDVKKLTGIENVQMINDLEANAYGLACLADEDFATIHDGKKQTGNIGIVAPGTGLGEAGLYWDGKCYHPFATEGGHTDFSPRTEADIALYHFLSKQHGVVSWEHIIAGPGIHAIFCFLAETGNYSMNADLKNEMQQEDASAVITKAAIENKSAICIETMKIYTRLLARECSNLALKMKATGGILLGGGIPPKIVPLLQDNAFDQHFKDCDRLQELIDSISVKIILNDKTPLLGAAFYAAYAM